MKLEVFLITGMAGSGKSVALHAFEDAGFYCVDNLPPELLSPLIALEHHRHGNRIAIAMDVRSSKSLDLIPLELQRLREQGVNVKTIFLDANIDTLIRRFSETRRRHPLSSEDLQEGRQALIQIIELERELLAQIREHSQVIDTSTLRPAQLQSYVKSLMVTAHGVMTLVFQSFAFKRSLPIDADFVFDVRMLPNPHYEPCLRELTGLDKPVANFLERQQEVELMERHIESFLIHWLDVLERNHRSYVTVAIGCTGGQHRSVYLVERLAQLFSNRWTTLKRHRELDNIHTKPL